MPSNGFDSLRTGVGGAGCPTGSVLNNGYEQLFIIGGPPTPPTQLPEPATVGLLGLALLSLVATSRKRKQQR